MAQKHLSGRDHPVNKGAQMGSEERMGSREEAARSEDKDLLNIHSSIQTECIQLLREMWRFHDEAAEFFYLLRAHVSQVRSLVKMDEVPSESNFKIDFMKISEDLKSICDSITVALNQYSAIAQFQAHLKLALFTKIRQAKQHLSQDRLGILMCTFNLVENCMKLRWWEMEGSFTGTKGALITLAQVYNWCLESTRFEPGESIAKNTGQNNKKDMKDKKVPNKVKILQQLDDANSNDCARLSKSLKSLSVLYLVEQLATKRAKDLCPRVCTILQSCDPPDTNIAKTEMDKLHAENLALFSHVFNCVGKRFSRLPTVKKEEDPSSNKEPDNGNDNTMSSSTKSKLSVTFQDTLWAWIGEITTDVALWSLQLNNGTGPLIFSPESLTKCSAFPLVLDDPTGFFVLLYRTVITSLNTFVQLTMWDDKMLTSYTIATAVKRSEQVPLIRNPPPGEFSSSSVATFGEICKSCILLLQQSREKTETIEVDPALENRIYEEAAVLFRLEATIAYFNFWMARRAKVWLNAWAITQFVACSQRDTDILFKLIQSKNALLVTRETHLVTDVTPLRLAALHRKACSDSVLQSLEKLKTVSEDLLLAVGPVTHTLSLATLQSSMPPSSHWRGVGPSSGLSSERPSPYVAIFIGRIIEPVMSALVEFIKGITQEAMGKHVVQAACEAWLEYLQQKRVRFSEWGAIQLLRDFSSLRDWISTETQLEVDARKSILQLEVLKRCEGVAYLLLRSPGDVLGVGKGGRKSRRIAPSGNGSATASPKASPSSSTSVAEDDIPPEMYVPNQQIWLELRFRRTLFSCCD